MTLFPCHPVRIIVGILIAPGFGGRPDAIEPSLLEEDCCPPPLDILRRLWHSCSEFCKCIKEVRSGQSERETFGGITVSLIRGTNKVAESEDLDDD